MKKYFPNQIETKWQKKWEEKKLYKFDPNSAKPKYYDLVEYPYPSGDLHIGHWFAFTLPDVIARFKRMQGYNVLFPIGFDAIGLPTENAAIKRGIHPQDWTRDNVAKMTGQFKSMGAMFSWDHEVITSQPDYMKWNQWIFIKMFEQDIAYRSKTLSNWCPVDQTVLADEHVEAGKCWRCGSDVVQKQVEQWFLRITAYADKLVWPENPETNWPNSVKVGQNDWIGRKEGIVISYEVEGLKDKIEVFTTRPDTNFGATFIALAPEHPLVLKVTTSENRASVQAYLTKASRKTELERKENKDKTGVFTGAYAINQLTGYRMPIWVSDFVLKGFGTGALVGVPGHDKRDFEFAKKFGLEVKRVVVGKDGDKSPITKINQVQEEEGVMVNSEFINGLDIHKATKKIMDYMEQKSYGKKTVTYHLHDWSISRQRYWGTPVPMIHCPNCGIMPVPLADLPVELPYDVDFTPKGKPPLASNEAWLKVKCPKCRGDAKRDAETLDTFFDSSWYYYRYLDPEYDKAPFDPELAKKLMPVDIYFGGAEHTLGHTLYARFFTRFFKDLNLVEFDEFAKKRVQHGIVLGPDGNKMSKSRGNVINPDEVVAEYGADTTRCYLCFMMPYEGTAPWSTEAISGMYRFLRRVWDLFDLVDQNTEGDKKDLTILNQTIQKVSRDLEANKGNTALAALMSWLNYLSVKGKISKTEYKTFILLLSPFAPHLTEEIWQLVGSRELQVWSVHQQPWPEIDKNYLETDLVNIVIQVNGKVRDTLSVDKNLEEEEIKQKALKSSKVQKFISAKLIKKTIYIPGKIFNIVI